MGIKLLKKYLPLNADTRYFLITGGRGSAKSFHTSTFLLNLTYEPDHIILFTRWTLVSAQISIIPEFIEKIELLNKHNDFIVKTDEIINKHTGSKILFKGIKTSQGTATANLKSISGVTTWVLDEAEELVDPDVFDKIDLSIRAKGIQNRIIMVMNPSYKTHFIYKRWFEPKREDTTYIHTTYLDNIKNLSASFVKQAEQLKEKNIVRYNHLFLGDWLNEDEGIFWNEKILNMSRVDKIPDLKRIVVAIDPATSKTADSDETGIVVCGVDQQNNGYLLEDVSGKYSPSEWGLAATKAADRWDADCIVAEKNQGGDMVAHVINSHNKKIRVKLVTATKGKQTRAEPIFGMYEQGKVFHHGSFPVLESQMISFNPAVNKSSPDRVDALVWGFTDLLLNFREASRITFTNNSQPRRRNIRFR